MESKRNKVEIKRLNQVAKVINGFFIDKADLDEVRGYPYLTPDTIDFTGIKFEGTTGYVSGNAVELEKRLTSAGDILLSIKDVGIRWYLLSEADPISFPGHGVILIRSKISDYISAYLSSGQGKQALRDIEAKWSISKQLSNYLFDKLNKLKVPVIQTNTLPDLSNINISVADQKSLEKLLDELTGLKKILESVNKERSADMSDFYDSSSRRSFFQKKSERIEFDSRAIIDDFNDSGPKIIFDCSDDSFQLDLFPNDTPDEGSQWERQKRISEDQRIRLDKSKINFTSNVKSSKSVEQSQILDEDLNINANYIFDEETPAVTLVREEKVDEPLNEVINTLSNELRSLDHSAFLFLKEFLEERFKKIEEQLKEVSGKLDDVLSILKGLQEEVILIKNLPRDEEERLSRIYIKIDERLDSLVRRDHKSHEMYVNEIKKWFEFWNDLEQTSRRFLPSAEFLYDEIFKLKEEADFSPFVIQYCRTLENEILKKLFVTYHEYIIQNGIDRNELVKYDLASTKIRSFADAVVKDNREYTLGAMRHIMSQLNEDYESYRQSTLLPSFKSFIRQYFEENVLEQSFLRSINTITFEFRNKAAHPHVMGLEVAKECQVLLRKCLIHFMSSRKRTASVIAH